MTLYAPQNQPGRDTMTSMGQHSPADAVHQAAGAPLRRARAAAWAVFLGMAGTTMTFQVFHAVTTGQMPWPLAVLYGIVPLAISIGVLEFAAVWGTWQAKTVAYTVTAGAMFLSAAATGSVTAHAAPSHTQLLFGALMDAAALLAIHFILSGPRAAQAVAAVARREAELTAQRDAERSARVDADRFHEAAMDGLREELDAVRADLRTAQSEAQRAALDAAAKAELLAGETGPGARSGTGTARRRTAPRTGAGPRGTAPENDLELEAKALKLLATDLTMSGAELGRKLGVTEGYGRKLRRRLTGDRPVEAVPDPAQDRSGTAPADRGENRA